MLYTEGCHNHLSLAKKMRRFADKLAVPPQMYLKYEVSVTLLKMEKKCTQKRPGAVTSKKSAPYVMHVMYVPLNLCIIQGHPHTVCNACNVCNDWNVCNVCPMCLNSMIIQGHPHNISKYALHRGVSQPPVFSKK